MTVWEYRFLGIYPCRVAVVLPDTIEELNKFLRDKADDQEGHTSDFLHGHCIASKIKEKGEWYKCCYIVIGPEAIDNKGVIAHEALHAVHFIFEDIGMKMSHKSIEAWTYLLEYITNYVHDVIDKKKAKQKK